MHILRTARLMGLSIVILIHCVIPLHYSFFIRRNSSSTVSWSCSKHRRSRTTMVCVCVRRIERSFFVEKPRHTHTVNSYHVGKPSKTTGQTTPNFIVWRLRLAYMFCRWIMTAWIPTVVLLGGSGPEVVFWSGSRCGRRACVAGWNWSSRVQCASKMAAANRK